MFASYATLYRHALVRHDERNFQLNNMGGNALSVLLGLDRKRPNETQSGLGCLFWEQELQAKPLSIDQHLAAVDAKIEALNLAKSK
ncbi:hypothetical protein BASA60_003450 [Batrachochytrium salamandrivorans]|nr:hypothetical protein BASA60_003450 [Batrachochytrium salamandrivorans]